MGLNTIKVSCSIAILVIIGCVDTNKNDKNANTQLKEDCKYYRYDAHRIVSTLGCPNCHTYAYERLAQRIPTLAELAEMDSLKLYKFAFKEKHKGWYSKNGNLKAVRMDTLSECEIKSAIRYIKDMSRNTPLPRKE